jgi:methionyl-tRNA synthetase
MNPEDFEFDEFMENSNTEFNSRLEEWKERLLIDAINTNYEQIESKGISDWHLRHMDADELKTLKSTLQVMLDHFQNLEEYEKCQVVFNNMKKIDFAIA